MEPLDAYSRDELLVLVRDLLHINAEQQERIVRLEEELARLGGGAPPSPTTRAAPPFVKANRPAREKKPRKK